MSRTIKRRPQDGRRSMKLTKSYSDFAPVRDLFRAWESIGFKVDHISVTTKPYNIENVDKRQWNYYRDGAAKVGSIKDINRCTEVEDDDDVVVIERSYKEKGRVWVQVHPDMVDYLPVRNLIDVWEDNTTFVKHVKVTALLQKREAKLLRDMGVDFNGGEWHYRIARRLH